MSRHRVSPQAGFTNHAKAPRGPNGWILCRQCGKETPGPRRTFCNDKCVSAWKMKTDPAHVRRVVFERDKGVCVQCGLDTVALERALSTLHWIQHRWGVENQRPEFREVSRLADEIRKILKVQHRVTYWDADHIVEVVNGGGECGLDNYQTLCCWCHRAKPVVKQDPARVDHRVV